MGADEKKSKLGEKIALEDLKSLRGSTPGIFAKQACFSCGNFWLDYISGSYDGLYPRGALIETPGLYGVGKSTLALECIAYNQFLAEAAGTKFNVLYVDFEKNLTLQQDLASAIGANLNDPNFFYVQPRTLESGTQFLIECLKPHTRKLYLKLDQPLDFVVIDTLSAARPRLEVDKKIGNTNIPGHRGKRWSEVFRNIQADLDPQGPAVVVINHLQEVIEMSSWPPKPPGPKRYDSPGSNALKLYAAQRYQLTRNEAGDLEITTTDEFTYEETSTKAAIAVRVECSKSKVGSPYRKSSFFIRPGFGIDKVLTMVEAAKRKKGALFAEKNRFGVPGSLGGGKDSCRNIIHGELEFLDYLNNSEEDSKQLAANLNDLWVTQMDYFWSRKPRVELLKSEAASAVLRAPVAIPDSLDVAEPGEEDEEGAEEDAPGNDL